MNTNKQPQYKRITAEERVHLACWAREGVSMREMARRLGRDAKTVRYELARSPAGRYCPIQAERQAGQRRHEWKARKLRDDDALRERVTELLGRGWTPERKSTRLNSSHLVISYAVFCLKKKRSNYHVTDVITQVRARAIPGGAAADH